MRFATTRPSTLSRAALAAAFAAVVGSAQGAPSAPVAEVAPAAQAAVAAASAAGTAARDDADRPDDMLGRLIGERGLLAAPMAALSKPVALVQSLRDAVRDRASDMVMTAMTFIGVPYRFGGTSSETGFDCSGFTRHVFERTVGLVLPRRAEEQARLAALQDVKRQELKPGDLVFFNTMKRAFSHVGIYVGEGKFIHAPRSGALVRVEDMRIAYWANRFDGARRAPGTVDLRAFEGVLASPAAAGPGSDALAPH